ncbi:MAG TPA: cation diffusion facilitator family transporter [Candidatus Acidoferrales bacterium]|nr:cation diffusion facilitator family transporter [Candidatus Acidoferrales bacterium]
MTRRPQLVALVSLFLGAVLLVAKVVVGLLTGSLGILSDAAHSALDLFASFFTWLAVGTARKPADREHPYGHGRAENLAAFAEGVLLLVAAVFIALEAVLRLVGAPARVEATGYAFGLLLVGILVEAGRAAVLRWVGRAQGSAALEADAENRLADVLSGLAVLAGLAGVRIGFLGADSLAALAVAALIARTAASIVYRSGDILMDRSPAGIAEHLRQTIGRVPGVREVRSVRVRRSGRQLLGEATVAAPSMLPLEAAKGLAEDVQQAVESELPALELTVVIEGQTQRDDLVERVHAAAARHGGIRDLHNVTVERERDGTLHLSMHAKLPGQLSLQSASGLTAGLERRLHDEIPEASRIDVHLEPLEPGEVSGADVTQRRAGLAARLRRLVETQPGVLACRDVELSSRGERLVAHVVAQLPGSLSLDEAHRVESELEARLRLELPELDEVVARATV